ncbi:spore coat associated protein CotJA [Desulfuribacillus stibiiarsenatis]
MPIYPVLPMPFDPFCPQFSPQEALEKGTLFKWLYDPYVPTMPRRRGLFG